MAICRPLPPDVGGMVGKTVGVKLVTSCEGVAEGGQVAEGDFCLSSCSHLCLIPSSGGLPGVGGSQRPSEPDLGLAKH